VGNTLPRDVHKTFLFGEVCRRYFPQQGACYIDLWPFASPFLLVTSPALAAQATQTNMALALERPRELRRWLRPLAGGVSLFDMSADEWRPWRAVFNKGFASAHVLSLVPGMVDECLVYRQKLRQHARDKAMFFLDPLTLRLTMDFIGRTVL
jgi:cytochrome P450